VAYAVALFLARDYPRALEVLHSFEKTLKEEKNNGGLKKHDKGELAFFEARILEEMGETGKASELL
jgi:hypothetical protein